MDLILHLADVLQKVTAHFVVQYYVALDWLFNTADQKLTFQLGPNFRK